MKSTVYLIPVFKTIVCQIAQYSKAISKAVFQYFSIQKLHKTSSYTYFLQIRGVRANFPPEIFKSHFSGGFLIFFDKKIAPDVFIYIFPSDKGGASEF